MLAQLNAAAGERQMIKNRSKKDLKNKFKSSSALYSEGAKAGEPEDEDDMKGDAEAKNISEIIQRHIQKEEAERERAGKGALGALGGSAAALGTQTGEGGKGSKASCQIDDSEIDEIIKQHLIEEETESKEK
jgi:hypothetical protein